jgi:acetyltransferase-like isoleucine patch superfamily enzyme
MPVNLSHAYGKGTLHKCSKYFERLKISEIFITLLEKIYTQAAWNAFRKNSIMGNDNFLGPNSWCTNFGKPENIVIGNDFYCRGLLHCGNRGRGRIIIGDGVYIGDDTIISADNYIKIGSFSMVSHRVNIFDTIGHPTDAILRERDWLIRMGRLNEPRPDVATGPINIGERVWIGFNSIVLRGVTINNNSIVAAGSVVVDNVPPNTIVAGNPAKVVKTII